MPALYLALLLALITPAAVAQECGAPPAADDGWDVASAPAASFDPTTLCGIGPRFEAWKEADIHAVLAARHGKLIYEHYFKGEDQRAGRPIGTIAFNAATRHDLRSITKGVTALLLGIAIGKGQIVGIDQSVLALLPEYDDLRTPEKDRITLRDLLTMSQGLQWNENLPYSDPRNSETQMDTAADPVRYVFSRPIETAPGGVFNYSGGSATIIARLLRKATGQPLDELARVELFEPLGIKDVEWWTIASGEAAAASGLRLRPRDTMKLGQLLLNHGVWNGRQVVPADWIADATAPRISAALLWFYGYQFWLGRSLVNGHEVEWIEWRGYGGQRLYVVPGLDVVVLVHAGLYRSSLQGRVPLEILNEYVLAAIRDH